MTACVAIAEIIIWVFKTVGMTTTTPVAAFIWLWTVATRWRQRNTTS
jgi:hypothetical protein